MKTHTFFRFLPAVGIGLILLSGSVFGNAASGSLEAGFVTPPQQAKPWCYWYWISDQISKEGVTRDLEAMARFGIGEALVGNIYIREPGDQPEATAGDIKVLSPAWWDVVEHAIREGGRTGVNIGMFNCPGWSQSGGPWIKPEQTMRYVVSSETRVTGPMKFSQKLPAPKDLFQQVAVLAFPAPREDARAISMMTPRVVCAPAVEGGSRLVDGRLDTTMDFPEGAGRGKTVFRVELETAQPFTARSLRMYPSTDAFKAKVLFEAADAQGVFQPVREFAFDRSNMAPGVGFMPRGPVTLAFTPITSTRFRLSFRDVSGRDKKVSLAEIELSGAARLEAFVEKQLGKMHPTPLPMWETYMWPTQAEPDEAGFAVPLGAVRDVTRFCDAEGVLKWDVPPGEWVILRTGMTPTGMQNAPASQEGKGLEVDKMNRPLAKYHFDAFIGQILRRMPASDRKAFTRVVADSYEMGSQNWTDGFGDTFRKRYGYDPTPWLPVLTGRLVGSADRSERFLWDLRRLVADHVATDYVGGLREACEAHGLGLWLENYGHWGFPGEFLKYGAESDRIGGEFWVTGDLGSIECRAASSCANTYGKPFVSAEAFTGGPAFQNAPGALKARGDWAFCEGVNHFVLHVYIQQPWEDRKPGMNAPWGTEFNRHNTWFEQGRAWSDYVQRCCWMLQQGYRVADVAYFIGEDAPKMTGIRRPELPPGRDFDYINADVIEKNLTVRNGLLALPHGVSYRLLVLPDQSTMRPELLRKLRSLALAGATLVGSPPSRSPSMEHFPKADAEVKALASEIWGPDRAAPAGEHNVGKGRVIWGRGLDEILLSTGCEPDFQTPIPLRFTHRRAGDTDIYFVANPKPEAVTVTAGFRAAGKAPELWWPDSGRVERVAVYDEAGASVRMPLQFGPHGSVFVVFRDKSPPPGERVVSVKRDNVEMLDTIGKPLAVGTNAAATRDFALAVWVRPTDATALPPESNKGVTDLSLKRNEVFAAPHGDELGGEGHAGCGLSVGVNGVAVYEHGANYYAPVLVHATPITNWTHVAVVYRDNQPSLYLNGVKARTGQPSTHVVHAPESFNKNARFLGKTGVVEKSPRAPAENEVAAWAKALPSPDAAGDPRCVRVVRGADGRIKARVGQPGAYTFRFGDGRICKRDVAALADPVDVNGPWDVFFSPGWGAPEKTRFETLISLTDHPLPDIRHYSGKVVYRNTFTLKSVAGSAILDLGEVCDIATVRVNDRELVTLWMAPWRVDITDAIKPGVNTLEIDVVNPWNNRLVGDALLPVDQRRTFLSRATVKAGTSLMPAGLLGPVRIRHALDIEVE